MAGVHGAVDMTIWRPLDVLLASYVANSFRQFTFIALEEEFDVPNDAAVVIKQSFPKLEEAKVLNVQMSNGERYLSFIPVEEVNSLHSTPRFFQPPRR